MHPLFSETMMRQTEHELRRKLRRADLRRPRGSAPAPPPEPVLLRLSRVHDEAALDGLAQLNGFAAALDVRHVVAEVGGEIVAALPLGSGRALADPFRLTAHVIPLLELRAEQLERGETRRRRGFAVWETVRGWTGA